MKRYRKKLGCDTRDDNWPDWGPIYLDDDEWEHMLRVMTTPQEPTETIKRGAELLRKLYPVKSK